MVFSNEQVGLMVEEICGEVVRTNFEDIEYGTDPMQLSDNKYSSMGGDDNSDNDEIEELYTDPAAPARGVVWDVERVELGKDPTPSATAQING